MTNQTAVEITLKNGEVMTTYGLSIGQLKHGRRTGASITVNHGGEKYSVPCALIRSFRSIDPLPQKQDENSNK